MDQTPGIAFEEFQKDERFKRLERNLKLAFAKQIERMKAGDQRSCCTSPTWPSISSINPDGLDTSCAIGTPSLQESRFESEVVSSSTNLHEVLPKHKSTDVERVLMATSSVKKFPVNDIDKDRAIMPPPPTDIMLFNSKRLTNADTKHKVQNQQTMETKVESHKSPMTISSCDSSATYESDRASLFNSRTSKGYRIFSRWRVLLNNQGQLIIKGTLECGKIARSKPVIQRLSSNQVKSLYQHIYVLNGNIVDDRNELPDYVRGKFHNGFPDDWENVYQLWRNYVADGCPVIFRWPLPIADSDDDLISEITDFNYINNKRGQEQIHFSKSASNDGSSGYHSKTQSDSHQNLEKSIDEQIDKVLPQIHHINSKIDDSEHFSEVKDNNSYNNQRGIENNKDIHSNSTANSTSTLKSASYLYEIIKEDKLRIILSNLGDKNCPPQYLDKFIELIDCLRYVLAYTPNSNCETEKKQNVSLPKSQTQSCQKCNNTASLSETQDINTEEQSENEICTKYEKIYNNVKQPEIENFQQKECYIQLKTVHSHINRSVSSDSDSYMGIPHVPVGHLIKSNLPRLQRYKYRTNHSKNRKSDSEEKLNEEPVKTTDNKQVNSRTSHTANKIGNKYNNNMNSELKLSLNSVEVVNELNNLDKQKPVLKSCESVNFNFNHRYLPKSKSVSNSDVSIVNDETFIKKQKLTKPKKHRYEKYKNNRKNINDSKEEELPEDIWKHPFITYDSDGDIADNEETILPLKEELGNHKKEKRISEAEAVTKNKVGKKAKCSKKEIEQKSIPSSEKKNIPANNEKIKPMPYGSKENPKLLTSWVPCVVYDDEYKDKCLKYEGKLLNENGHILQRKFITNAIYLRHSLKLVETVNNEYFILDGELTDTKHVIPKDLVKLCRAGCPSKIKAFCEEWIKLKEEENNDTIASIKSHDTSIDRIQIPTSSCGRRILSPLSYCTGGKISAVNNPVYHPGCKQGSVLALKLERSKNPVTPSEQQLKSNKQKENLKTGKSSAKPAKSEDASFNQNVIQKSPQKRIAIQLTYTSSSSSEEQNASKNKKNIKKSKQLSIKSRPVGFTAMQVDPQPSEEIIEKPTYNVMLTKKQRVNTKKNNKKNSVTSNRRSQVSTKNYSSEMTWTLEEAHYYDALSDD